MDNNPNIVDSLAQAIAHRESGGKYDAIGPTNKDGSKALGKYQILDSNVPSWTQEAVGKSVSPQDFLANPQLQDMVAKYHIGKIYNQYGTPQDTASVWFSGQPIKHNQAKDVTGTSVPSYVQDVMNLLSPTKAYAAEGDPNGAGKMSLSDFGKKVQAKYWQYSNLNPEDVARKVIQKYPQYQSQIDMGESTGTPAPTPKPGGQTGGHTLTMGAPNLLNPFPVSVDGQPSLGEKVVKGVGNFLFPVVGDVYHDIKGDSNKSLLQQAGDLGLSALPFIPGLGEVGEAARVGEGVAEGARAVKGTGMLAKLLASATAKHAVVGYGSGVAANLSQGKGIGESISPNVNTIGGTIFGAAAPQVTEGLGKLSTKLSGIDPKILNELKQGGITLEEYNSYINAAKNHATNLRSSSPLELAADKLDTAASTIDKQVSEAGKSVGQAKSQIGKVPLPDMSQVAKDFTTRVENDYGLRIAPNGKGVLEIKPVAGRTPPIDAREQQRLLQAYRDVIGIQVSNGQNASDVIAKLDNSINYAKAERGGNFDPIEGLLKSTRDGINEGLRKVSPDLAGANDKFSVLKRLQTEINKMAGGLNQRGELLMRRVFSGDKSGEVQDLFGKIKQATGIDLVNHATLAKHAIETAGDASQKTLLQQYLEKAVGEGRGLIGGALNLAKGALQHTVANPETIGRKAVTGGGPGILPELFNKAAIEAGSRAGTLVPRGGR